MAGAGAEDVFGPRKCSGRISCQHMGHYKRPFFGSRASFRGPPASRAPAWIHGCTGRWGTGSRHQLASTGVYRVDPNQLRAVCGIAHCALLPLRVGGGLGGALLICLGGPANPLPGSIKPPGAPGSAPAASSATATGEQLSPAAANSAVTSAAEPPNWLPHHLPELSLLSAAVCGAVTGPYPRDVQCALLDLVAALRRSDSINALISAVVSGLADLATRVTCGMAFTVTPLLTHRTGATAAIFQDVDVKKAASGSNLPSGAAAGPVAPTGDASASPSTHTSPIPEPSRTLRAHVTHLNHTLLLQLITGVDVGRYRKLYCGAIIPNCSEHVQDETNRGRDVSLCHRVGVADTGSLVAAAGLLPGGGPLLCAYLTSREPLPETLLEAALAVVHQALQLCLYSVHMLLSGAGEVGEEWSTLHDVHLHPSSVAVSTTCTPRSLVRSGTGPHPAMPHAASMPSASPACMAPDELGAMTNGNSTSAMRRQLSFSITTTSAAAAPRSNLGMMVSSIRSSLNAVLSQRAVLEAEGLQDDVNGVELLKQIGQGGQGVVFCGTLHGLEVAIKVVGTEEGADEVYDIDDEGAMIKLKRVLKRDATELAVTTSISHPNIVQVFSYFVDVMVVEYVGQPDRFKLLPKAKGHAASGADGGVGVTGPSNMIICMEYCDAGSLKHAVKRGCFRAEASGGSRPHLTSLYTTLMEIALALRHLHALRLVHCDLKPSNILLKSSMRDPRGWVCKLSDFGCVRLMSEPAPGQRPSFNLEYAVGTPSFMAPEMFCKGHPLDAAVDVYSFGILMYEVYTGSTVYDGVPPDKLPYHVVKRGLRPAFPPDTPSAFRSLAQACWASDPRSRPTAAALVTVLQRLLSSCVNTSQGV
ncbi:hypothetical protein HXX76_009424 [Chlamydomonas incerta]|uniref:Protein kinase domain-containing protein n=1 Tax=Chlamydomonas incerta TaxID=51695 RepID=A0A835SQN2_CHLIN|nr:hypothetical protein HXX76_009424 [Chlamydomonas incerta]|eukprot:KAG2431409.1 hypothetical protein HXX76_009424 [Chlamydomonas incerta]